MANVKLVLPQSDDYEFDDYKEMASQAELFTMAELPFPNTRVEYKGIVNVVKVQIQRLI